MANLINTDNLLIHKINQVLQAPIGWIYNSVEMAGIYKYLAYRLIDFTAHH